MPRSGAVLAIGLSAAVLTTNVAVAAARAASAPTASQASEATPPDFGKVIDLATITTYALAHNAEIRAMEQRRLGAEMRPTQEGSLPNPLVNTAWHNESFDSVRLGDSDFAWLRLGLEQELPFPGKLALRAKIAAREADREGALYTATVLGVLARVRVAYADYVLAFRSKEALSGNKELLEKLSQGAEARYRVGQGLQQDIVRAQLEQSTLLGRIVSVDQERQSAAAILNALLDRPPSDPFGAPKPPDKQPLRYTLAQLEGFVREKSPQLAAASFEVARAQANLDLAGRAYYPDFVVRADYFNKSSLTPEWEVGAGIRVPLYFWRKEAYGEREAAAGVGQARAARRSAEEEVLAKLTDLFAQATSAERLIELYGSGVVPQAEVSLSSASSGYEVGKVDFLTLLSSFTVLNEYQLRYYEELAKFDKAMAQLEELAGIPPVAEASRSPGPEKP